jgi:hypothetical protein
MEVNKALSDSAYVSHGLKNLEIEFPRVTSQDISDNLFTPLTIQKNRPVITNFCWGWNKKPCEYREPGDIDKEVARELLRLGLFHLHDRVAIKLLPTKIDKSDGAYTSYVTPIAIMERARR